MYTVKSTIQSAAFLRGQCGTIRRYTETFATEVEAIVYAVENSGLVWEHEPGKRPEEGTLLLDVPQLACWIDGRDAAAGDSGDSGDSGEDWMGD